MPDLPPIAILWTSLDGGLDQPVARACHPDAGAALTGAGLADVVAERIAQIEANGFTLAHDEGHHPAQLAAGAASYLNTGIDQLNGIEHDPQDPADTWPWEREAWRPGDARTNIVKALAIGLAVLDRLDGKAA